MVKRALVLLSAVLALLLAGCAASAKPDVQQLREKYPLYIENQLICTTGPLSLSEQVQHMPVGVLATIVTGPEDVRLRNENADGSKAIATLQPIAVEYARYVLRVDTVLFGENPGSEIAVYLPRTLLQPQQDVDKRVGGRFFYVLARYPQERQTQLATLLAANSTTERLPIWQGSPAAYWTQEGVMLSAFSQDSQIDGMTKEQFIAAIVALTQNRDPLLALRLEYQKHKRTALDTATPLSEDLGRADYGVLATVAADPQPLRLGADRYIRYTLRIDSVVFGSLKARTIDLYLAQAQADDTAAQLMGSRFFYPLFELSAEEKESMAAKLQSARITQRNPMLSGEPMYYCTRYGTMLSVAGEGEQTRYDLLPQTQFVRAMRELREKYKPPVYPAVAQ